MAISKRSKRLLLLLFLAAGTFLARHWEDWSQPRPAPPGESPAQSSEKGDSGVLWAFQNKVSNQWVEDEGVVERLLKDDTHGSRHQRFILRLSSSHTILLSHNIDLAPRLDGLQIGDRIGFRGEYEWNDKGGVVHWTHHDPSGGQPGGWLDHQGRRYR